MTKKELKRERDAKRYWKRRAKLAEKQLRQTSPVLVPSVFNVPLPTSGKAWPKIGDVTCSLGDF